MLLRFGGPDGLAYLRSLPFVDKENIGLEGHSMGGWTVLAAAAAMPNDYKSMVLEGSSTGKPFAAEGTTSWPRNTALVFAQYEEFPDLMWGVQLARDVTTSPKLWALFGTQGAVEPGKVYGDPANGTGQVGGTGNTGLAALIQEAVALHEALADAKARTHRLIGSLRRHRRQSKLVTSTLRSLKELRLQEVTE